jgi:hypothetical protein
VFDTKVRYGSLCSMFRFGIDIAIGRLLCDRSLCSIPRSDMFVVFDFGLISILRCVAPCAMCRYVRYQGPIMCDRSLVVR